MPASEKLIPTTQVGAYPKPAYYHQKLGAQDLDDALKDIDFREAYYDAVHLGVGEMDMAGLDIIPDPRQWYDGAHIESFFWYAPERTPGYNGWGDTPDLILRAVEKKAVKPGFLNLVNEYHRWPYVESTVEHGPYRLAQSYRIAQKFTTAPIRMPGPGCGPCHLALVSSGPGYKAIEDLAYDLGRIYNEEFKEVTAAGARHIQLDDLTLFLSTVTGKEDAQWMVDAINRAFEGINARKTFHICFGTWWANIGFPGSKDGFGPIMEPLLDIKADELMLEFPAQAGRPWGADLKLWKEYEPEQDLSVGTYGPRSLVVESPEEIADNMREALKYADASKLSLTSDRGLRILGRPLARAKMESAKEGAEIVRNELT